MLIFELDDELTLDDEEQLVLLVVFMPREGAFDFSYFDEVSAIEFAYDPRRPMLIQLGKFIGEIDFLNHGGCS